MTRLCTALVAAAFAAGARAARGGRALALRGATRQAHPPRAPARRCAEQPLTLFRCFAES